MKWLLILSACAALVSQGRAASPAQCSELLQRGLEAKNPETRKQAVVALSLAGQRGPLFARLQSLFGFKRAEALWATGNLAMARCQLDLLGDVEEAPLGLKVKRLRQFLKV